MAIAETEYSNKGASSMTTAPFHLSIPVKELSVARAFYGGLLGCPEGRSAERRIDFNFFGHHLVVHVEPSDAAHQTTTIDSGGVLTPCRHFGVVLPQSEWGVMAEKLTAAEADFYAKPHLIFAGETKEQSIMLVNDGSGNVVEFKAIAEQKLFAV